MSCFLLLLSAPGFAIVGCGGSDGSPADANAGGAASAGHPGAAASAGRAGGLVSGNAGASPAGGSASSAGQSPSVGGADASSAGAAAMGGTAMGGTATGGTSSAGAPGTSGSAGTAGKGSAGASANGGGSSGSGGGSASLAPCDIYAAGNTPCVAAHSTVRALFGSYTGNLYQVRRASDKTTKDIAVQGPDGFANSAAQDTFCANTTCTISVIYDQSTQGNHLTVTPPGGWLANGGTEAKASAAKITVGGHAVYGVYTTGSFDEAVGGVGYRNNKTKGVATGDQPEGIYMVASGKHYNQWCCFDYGNAETNNKDNGPGTMETLYFGNSTQWGRGSGTGPWVMADLEDGVFGGGSFAAPPSNTSLSVTFVTAMLGGKAGSFRLKGGDSQSGTLKTMYDGARPSGGYDPMKKEGAIILGVGGDNSHTGEGTFFEGCLTSGYPSDASENAVQANIVAAGYGR
ncbi:MAG TPA: arabinofuranosidase catalytic domain-containing protein [Polyangiaceae bacterium]|nr:arabinofuranosidase catalytic domain-containing protein [Polyangiaceae bacterium]